MQVNDSSSGVEADFGDFDAAARRSGFFTDGITVHVARAPGRLDVMGGIADYSGSLVAEMPIGQAAVAGVQVGGTEGDAVLVATANATAEGLTPLVTLPQELFTNPVSLLKHLRDAPSEERWAGYAAGCVSLLRAESLIPRGVGLRILLRSDVPLGAGVSSSAAVEVSAMRALTSAFGVPMDGLTLARLCQRVENDVMDAPCGIMDQVTSALGEAGKLLLLLCQPSTLEGTVELPAGWSVFGVDSGVKHSVGGRVNPYTRVRVAAFMGYRILADRAKSGFGGYLCNVGPERYREIAPDGLPESLGGADFLNAHGGIYDTVTTVEPGETYPVRAATEHPIYEMQRVRRFVQCLRDASDDALARAGEEMYAAHASYSACGIGSGETDLLVELARSHPEVAGAKITGGGSGGTVCLLCRADAEERISLAVAEAYRNQTGITPRVIRGTSPGAFSTRTRELTL